MVVGVAVFQTSIDASLVKHVKMMGHESGGEFAPSDLPLKMPARLTEVALETIKAKYLKNLEIIDRLYEEKRALEEAVGDLSGRRQTQEIAAEEAAFQPWWEYEADPAEEEDQLLLSASAAAKLFANEPAIRKPSKTVGLSRHLQADADKYLAKQMRLDDRESREASEHRAFDEARFERRRLSAAASGVGAFAGLERREHQAQQRRQRKQEEREQAEEEEAKANEARRRELLNNGALPVAISWDTLQQNAETQRRERIEVRKMQTYAESKAPKAAKPRAPTPQPEPFDTAFTAPDPIRVMANLEQKKIAGRKLDESRAGALLARQEAEAVQAKRIAKQQCLSLSGQAKRLSQEHRGRRQQQAELSKVAEARRGLFQEKGEIERVFNDTLTAMTSGRRLNKASELRTALVRGAMEREMKLQQSSRPTTANGQHSEPDRPARRPSSAREAHSKERQSKEEGEEKSGKEEASRKWRMDEDDDEERAVYERARATPRPGRGGSRVLTPRSTLIERHDATTARQQAADLALGIAGRGAQ